jgi:hypothetical protein
MERGDEDRFERDENVSALNPALRLESFFFTSCSRIGMGVT